jgi:hypothetical protein
MFLLGYKASTLLCCHAAVCEGVIMAAKGQLRAHPPSD